MQYKTKSLRMSHQSNVVCDWQCSKVAKQKCRVKFLTSKGHFQLLIISPKIFFPKITFNWYSRMFCHPVSQLCAERCVPNTALSITNLGLERFLSGLERFLADLALGFNKQSGSTKIFNQQGSFSTSYFFPLEFSSLK